MNKRILSALISLTLLVSLTSSAFALYKDPEETTTAAVETTAEQVTESQEATEGAPSETQAPSETETVAVTESEAQVEDTTPVAETTVAEEPTFQTVEETTEATESIPSDVNIYVTEQGTEVKKLEEEEKDPKLKVFFGGLLIGLILGGVCGWFLATFIIKQKLARQHDEMYESIKHGQKSISDKYNNEKKQAEREALLEKRKEEARLKKEQQEKQKKEKAEKRAELAKNKDAEKLRKLQEKMGLPVTPVEPQNKDSESDVEIEIITDSPKEEEKPEPEEVVEPVKEEKAASDEPVDPEKMIYQGEDSLGDPYYTDPDDPDQEPFRIENGKKVFYD